MSKKKKERKRQSRQSKKASDKYAEFRNKKDERIKARLEANKKIEVEQVQNQEIVDRKISWAFYREEKKKRK